MYFCPSPTLRHIKRDFILNISYCAVGELLIMALITSYENEMALRLKL